MSSARAIGRKLRNGEDGQGGEGSGDMSESGSGYSSESGNESDKGAGVRPSRGTGGRRWVRVDEELRKTKLRPNERLYCEGSMKPYWRGKLHLLAFFLFPLSLTSLMDVSETQSELLIGAFTFAISNMMSFGISFMFHCFEWTPRVEILLQKIDHAAIFLNTAVAITQYCIFTIRTNRMELIYITWILGFWGVYQVFSLKKQTIHHLIASIPLFWIVPELSRTMTNYQFSLFLITWLQVFVGLIAYGLRWPTPWPKVFGYHEIMHLLTTTGALTAIFLQHNLLEEFDHQFCLFAESIASIGTLES